LEHGQEDKCIWQWQQVVGTQGVGAMHSSALSPFGCISFLETWEMIGGVGEGEQNAGALWIFSPDTRSYNFL